jgi:4-amino-4-deoxy-L-arabinose transferase-like glycosyltransferase
MKKENSMTGNVETIANESIGYRLLAVCEMLVVFAIVFALTWLLPLLPLAKVARNFLAYLVMMIVPLIILLVSRRNLKTCGLSFHQVKDQLSLTLSLLPVALIQGAVTGWLLPMLIPNAIIRWEAALVLTLAAIVFFLWMAVILRRSQPWAR